MAKVRFAPPQDAQFVTYPAIYAGRRQGAKGVMLSWIGRDDGEEGFFSSPAVLKQFKRSIIGGIYELSRHGSSFRFSNVYLGFSDSAKLAEWRAADQAYEVTARARKFMEAEKAKGKEALLEMLQPFHKQYIETDTVGKLALEVVLLAALRNPYRV